VYKEGAQVCLLTKDPQRTFKDVVKEKKIDSVGKASSSLLRECLDWQGNLTWFSQQ